MRTVSSRQTTGTVKVVADKGRMAEDGASRRGVNRAARAAGEHCTWEHRRIESPTTAMRAPTLLAAGWPASPGRSHQVVPSGRPPPPDRARADAMVSTIPKPPQAGLLDRNDLQNARHDP